MRYSCSNSQHNEFGRLSSVFSVITALQVQRDIMSGFVPSQV